jgi:serine phosphatase RsbU (regulator of sigma subunit)/CheY-like chemotaxis protein
MTQGDKSKLKLMVVDDESDNLDLLYRTFRRDFRVFKAESALKALQILEQEGEMGIIISDQRMPRMSGIEFLSRTVEQFPDTIRIVLTGYTDVEDLVSAINTGKVFKYITKPWNPEELKTVVQQAAETYYVLKQRTNELRRALHRESIFNAVTTAIRESLDYRSMLQTIVETIGQTFAVDTGILRPVADSRSAEPQQHHLLPDAFLYQAPTLPISKDSSSDPDVVSAMENNADQQLNLEQPHQADFHSNEAEVWRSVLENHQPQLCQLGDGSCHTQLIVPLTYQQDVLAILILCRDVVAKPWLPEEIELLNVVAEQAALAISQAKLYQRIQEQTQQMIAELAVARQIQSSLLRQKLPELDGIKVQACCYPARAVGGDFFEVFVHPQGDLWLAVGDVSGKGVPAALFMASAISVLRRELAQESPPEPNQVMQNLNNSLLENLVGGNCFITMVLARYTPNIRQLVYANAGHIYPLVWSRQRVAAQLAESGEAVEPTYLKVRGVPLGILPTWCAPAGQLTLESGEVLLLTSDGITEAAFTDSAADGHLSSRSMLQQIGLWRLLLQERGALNLADLLAHIQSHNQVQEDDQTILSLEVL